MKICQNSTFKLLINEYNASGKRNAQNKCLRWGKNNDPQIHQYLWTFFSLGKWKMDECLMPRFPSASSKSKPSPVIILWKPKLHESPEGRSNVWAPQILQQLHLLLQFVLHPISPDCTFDLKLHTTNTKTYVCKYIYDKHSLVSFFFWFFLKF